MTGQNVFIKFLCNFPVILKNKQNANFIWGELFWKLNIEAIEKHINKLGWSGLLEPMVKYHFYVKTILFYYSCHHRCKTMITIGNKILDQNQEEKMIIVWLEIINESWSYKFSLEILS